jgi:hypothetical protein
VSGDLVLGIVESAKEDKAGWWGFLKHLKECMRAPFLAVTGLPNLGIEAEIAHELFR